MKKLLKALDEFAYDVLEGMNPIYIFLTFIAFLMAVLFGIEIGR